MLDVLKFIFSSFWIWAGMVVLLAAPLAGLRAGSVVVQAFRDMK